MSESDTLTEKLDRILSDPAIAALGQEHEAAPSSPQAASAQDQSAIPPDTSANAAADLSGIGRLLSDPAMLAKLPQILTLLKPILQKTTEKQSQTTPTVGTSPQRKPPDGRIALLLALKPYLSKSRCDSIDTIVTFCKLNDLLSGLL